VLVDQNEIAYNNTAGFNSGWEAGGTKFVMTHNLVVRGNWSHHNSRNDRFTNNRYGLGGGHVWPFAWMGREISDTQWPQYGHDVGGVFQR
jgi:hypothetical protein